MCFSNRKYPFSKLASTDGFLQWFSLFKKCGPPFVQLLASRDAGLWDLMSLGMKTDFMKDSVKAGRDTRSLAVSCCAYGPHGRSGDLTSCTPVLVQRVLIIPENQHASVSATQIAFKLLKHKLVCLFNCFHSGLLVDQRGVYNLFNFGNQF